MVIYIIWILIQILNIWENIDTIFHGTDRYFIIAAVQYNIIAVHGATKAVQCTLFMTWHPKLYSFGTFKKNTHLNI